MTNRPDRPVESPAATLDSVPAKPKPPACATLSLSALTSALPQRSDWDSLPLDSARSLVAAVQESYLEGSRIINQRHYDAERQSNTYVCIVCRKRKPMTLASNPNQPNWVHRQDVQDPQTKLWTARIVCSSECFFRASNTGQFTRAGMSYRAEDAPKGHVMPGVGGK